MATHLPRSPGAEDPPRWLGTRLSYDRLWGTADDLLHYRYRGTDPQHRDNVGLRTAWRREVPLIYFHGVLRGRYVTSLVRRRLHQRSFRERVLRAYRDQCALCRLRHQELLALRYDRFRQAAG